MVLKGIGGVRFILIHVIALSFFFPKWGHMFLNHQIFSFYDGLNEGRLLKYGKNCTFWEIVDLNNSFLGIYWPESAKFGFGQRYWCDLKILCSKSWNVDGSEFYDPSKLSILSKSVKILLFSNLTFIVKIYLIFQKSY